ncbi:Ras GTPase-activating protein 3 [Trichinella pseudospiralis]|uniref:Ras GTPase-activating protein 3 n=1 Tax=Trichinella pseudospiralis TaxID=6337 RepID=A0A0V1EFC9_TRIPS|nr:Ras GTPase-activating protein 3 [Trichinella pseudospiralis]
MTVMATPFPFQLSSSIRSLPFNITPSLIRRPDSYFIFFFATDWLIFPGQQFKISLSFIKIILSIITVFMAADDKPPFMDMDKDNVAQSLRFVDILDLRLVEARNLSLRQGSSAMDHFVCCVIKLDSEEIFRSSTTAKTTNPFFGDDFHFEVQKKFRLLSFYLFDHYPGRVARPLGRITFCKDDIFRYSGVERWFPLKPISRHSEGKVCLELSYEYTNDSKLAKRLKVRLLDFCDLSLPVSRPGELYALVHLQRDDEQLFTDTKKLRVRRLSPESYSMAEAVYVDLPSGCFAKQAAITDEADFSIDPHPTTSVSTILRVSLWHDMPRSFSTFFHGEVRVPLTGGRRQFHLSNIAWYYLKPRSRPSERDRSAKRNQSINANFDDPGDLCALKLRIRYNVDHILPSPYYNELWRLLLDSLSCKPFRASALSLLSCLPKTEVDNIVLPVVRIFLHSNQVKALIQTQCIEEISQCQDVNTLFRSCSFATRCVFELMKLVGHQYLISTLKPCLDKIYAERKCCEVDPDRLQPGQTLVDNLFCRELSIPITDVHSCLKMLLKFFEKLRLAFIQDATVARTLALVSKTIQRLSNFVVCGRKLSEKEAFMVPLWERFADERHRLAFIKFFDRISCVSSESSMTGESVTVLKEGVLFEYKANSGCLGRRCLSSKPRYCCLTDNEFYWCKHKGSVRLGLLHLSDIVLIQAIDEKSQGKMAALKKACRRQQLALKQINDACQYYEIDIEQQLENIHLAFLRHIETVRAWKEASNGKSQDERQDVYTLTGCSDEISSQVLHDSIQAVLACTYTLEQGHRAALVKYLRQMKYGSKDLPIGDDNYLLLRSRIREYASISWAPLSQDEDTTCIGQMSSTAEENNTLPANDFQSMQTVI